MKTTHSLRTRGSVPDLRPTGGGRRQITARFPFPTVGERNLSLIVTELFGPERRSLLVVWCRTPQCSVTLLRRETAPDGCSRARHVLFLVSTRSSSGDHVTHSATGFH